MNRYKVAIMAVALLFVMAGCAGQNTASEQGSPGNMSRQARLLADENARLRSQISKLDDKLAKTQKALDECNKQKADIDKNSNAMLGSMIEQSNTEKQQYEKRIDELTKEIEQLKKSAAK
jgi:DNA anti-recombination protein RmuC